MNCKHAAEYLELKDISIRREIHEKKSDSWFKEYDYGGYHLTSKAKCKQCGKYIELNGFVTV
jgi:hypothetical protein